jgi:hypothetical protein
MAVNAAVCWLKYAGTPYAVSLTMKMENIAWVVIVGLTALLLLSLFCPPVRALKRHPQRIQSVNHIDKPFPPFPK